MLVMISKPGRVDGMVSNSLIESHSLNIDSLEVCD